MSDSFPTRSALFTAAVVVGFSGCSERASGPNPVLTAFAVAATNGQTGPAGTALSQPLQVKVQSDLAPKAGVTVVWTASGGSVDPASNLTNVNGVAATRWILGTASGTMVVSATVAGAQGSPVTFSATALPVTANVADGNGQTGRVGSALLQPLRVRVHSSGAPAVGLTVTWEAVGGGRVAPSSSITDAQGIATATWTLGGLAGRNSASANVSGALGSPVPFTATALPGPAAAVVAQSGDGLMLPVNHQASLFARITDRYGNGVEGLTLTWSVVNGPITVLTTGQATDASGFSIVAVAPTGTEGAAVVRASLAGVAALDFSLTVGPPEWDVTLRGVFISAQNGSENPAVDTIPAGGAIKWTLYPIDYENHRVISVGTPSFQGGDFPYANPSTVRVEFTTPGTYQYTDFYQPTHTGIIVVQPPNPPTPP